MKNKEIILRNQIIEIIKSNTFQIFEYSKTRDKNTLTDVFPGYVAIVEKNQIEKWNFSYSINTSLGNIVYVWNNSRNEIWLKIYIKKDNSIY